MLSFTGRSEQRSGPWQPPAHLPTLTVRRTSRLYTRHSHTIGLVPAQVAREMDVGWVIVPFVLRARLRGALLAGRVLRPHTSTGPGPA